MPLWNVMNRGLRLPRIGTIRKGIQVPVLDKETGKPKKKNGNIVTYPKEVPYFVFKCAESTGSDAANEIEQAIYAAYGSNQIYEINCFLAYPDAMQNFSFWMEAYTFNQLVARSDERVITYLFDIVTNETLIKDSVIVKLSSNPSSPAGKIVAPYKVGDSVPYVESMVLGKAKDSERPLTFKAVGRLTLVIRELKRLATFTLITGGYWSDIPQIYSTIEIIDQIVKSTGRGANTIPVSLRRVPREVHFTDENGDKKKKTSYDVQMEIRSDIIAGLLETYNDSPFALALSGGPVTPALPEHVDAVAEDYTEAIEAEAPEEVKAVEETDRNDEQIDPFDQKPVEYAAKAWNTTKEAAAATLGEIMKTTGRVKNPMGKKAFKKLVDSMKE